MMAFSGVTSQCEEALNQSIDPASTNLSTLPSIKQGAQMANALKAARVAAASLPVIDVSGLSSAERGVWTVISHFEELTPHR